VQKTDGLRRLVLGVFLGFLVIAMSARKGDDDAPPDGLLGAGTKALNYTPWYIHTFQIEGPSGSRIGGGGPNVFPADAASSPSGGGKEMCCATVPYIWQPDLKLTVRWLACKKQNGSAQTSWYRAENVRFAKYDGKKMGNVWAIFLPGDKIRLMIADGNSSGGNDLDHRPPDDDPYVVQGTINHEWNRLYREGGEN